MTGSRAAISTAIGTPPRLASVLTPARYHCAACALLVHEPGRTDVDRRLGLVAEVLSFSTLLDWSHLVARAASRS